MQDQQLLLTPFTVQTAAAGGVVNNDKYHLLMGDRVHLFSFESGFFLGQIWFNIISEPLVNAPLTSISKKSPCFSSGSVARHQRDMDFEANIFSHCINISLTKMEEKTISSHGFISPSGRVEGAKNSVISR